MDVIFAPVSVEKNRNQAYRAEAYRYSAEHDVNGRDKPKSEPVQVSVAVLALRWVIVRLVFFVDPYRTFKR